MTAHTSRWLTRDTARPEAGMRLVYFPHAEGSAGFYRSWGQSLTEVEVHAVQYPGRADRLDEEPPHDLVRLAADIAEALEPLADLPLAFFGHSLGAPIALETARAAAPGHPHRAPVCLGLP